MIAAGGAPVLLPVGGDPDRARDYIGILDGLLLPGGEDVTPALYGEEPRPQVTYMNEDKDRLEMELLRLVLGRRLPVFGICRGMQLLAAALGGALCQDLPTQHPGSIAHAQDQAIRAQPTHRVTLAPDSLLEEILGREQLRVNSYHHQAVKTPPPGFQITAWAALGALDGGYAGAEAAKLLPGAVLQGLMLAALPVVAVFLALRKDLGETAAGALSEGREAAFGFLIGLAIGCYDGLVGPGTGTFPIMLFTAVLHLDLVSASGCAKVVNLASNAAAAVSFVLGGGKRVRGMIFTVLALMFVKLLADFVRAG